MGAGAARVLPARRSTRQKAANWATTDFILEYGKLGFRVAITDIQHDLYLLNESELGLGAKGGV